MLEKEVKSLKIEEAKKLDDGVSGIIIEGKIIKTPKEPRDSEYGWSQMIILKDDTGEIGSWINIESAEDAYRVGQYIKVKGKVSKYVKGGKPGISLNNANVIDAIVKVDEDVSQDKPQPTIQKVQNLVQEIAKEKVEEKEYTNNDYWHDKTLRDIENNKCIVRECAIKAVTELVNAVSDDKKPYIGTEKEYFGFADRIVDYIYETKGKITSEDITKEFGGTVEEEKHGTFEVVVKEQRIAQAKEIVGKATKLTEPQKNMVEKIIKSRYIKKEELEKMGGGGVTKSLEEARSMVLENLNKITKDKASSYIPYWFGNDAKLGERDKRELAANEKKEKENPFVTKREPIEKRDPKDNASLAKDLIIEKIQKLRKDNVLEDDAKFTKEFECNTRFELWSEKELGNLKEKLEIWRPDWITKGV